MKGAFGAYRRRPGGLDPFVGDGMLATGPDQGGGSASGGTLRRIEAGQGSGGRTKSWGELGSRIRRAGFNNHG
jgi:hypothetical protein